jgi:hypothetical protein
MAKKCVSATILKASIAVSLVVTSFVAPAAASAAPPGGPCPAKMWSGPYDDQKPWTNNGQPANYTGTTYWDDDNINWFGFGTGLGLIPVMGGPLVRGGAMVGDVRYQWDSSLGLRDVNPDEYTARVWVSKVDNPSDRRASTIHLWPRCVQTSQGPTVMFIGFKLEGGFFDRAIRTAGDRALQR